MVCVGRLRVGCLCAQLSFFFVEPPISENACALRHLSLVPLISALKSNLRGYLNSLLRARCVHSIK